MEDTKNLTRPLIIALQHHDIFDLESPNADTEVLPEGIAFSFIKAVHALNKRLVSHISSESLGFEVILIANECSEETKVKIVESVKHYDSDDIYKALHADVPAAVLYDQNGVLDQLKVTFSGDIIGLSEDSLDSLADFGFSESQIKTFKSAKICMKEFVVLIGEMRRRFGHENSPLCTCLITAWGSRNVCLSALKILGEWGLDVDEAFCMAGAPCSPILAVVKPHILWDGGLHNLRDLPNFEL